MRLFFGVFPTAEFREALEPVQQKVKGYKGWKATPADHLHVTLLFLGDVPDGKMPEVKRIGKEVAAGFPPFEVSLGGAGYFPATGSPRVWFVKTEADSLGGLAAAFREKFPEADTKEKFHPHITIARKKNPAPRVTVDVPKVSFQALEVCLVESKLDPKGSQYRVISRFPFIQN